MKPSTKKLLVALLKRAAEELQQYRSNTHPHAGADPLAQEILRELAALGEVV